MTDLEKKEYQRQYYQKNKQKISDKAKEYRKNNNQQLRHKKKEYYENNKENARIYYQNNRENNKEKKRKYYENNKQIILKNIKEYKENNKEKLNEQQKKYQKNRKRIDPLFKLNGNIRNLIGKSIKRQGYTKKSRTYQMLGCTYEEFKKHLERQFTIGMTWDNRSEWHLDHIIPVSIAKDEQELIKLNHYTNFQPLWAIDNLLKGNKVISNTQIKLI